MRKQDPNNHNDPRYQDVVSHDQFSLIVSSGPMWARLATRFRTPYNVDLTQHLEGPHGFYYSSNDNGNWWFKSTYLPLKSEVDKTTGYRRNETDPLVHCNGLAPYARMITKGVPSVEWPDPITLHQVAFFTREIENRVLSPKEALVAGYVIKSQGDAPFSVNTLPDGLSANPSFNTFPHADYGLDDNVISQFESKPHYWLEKPTQPVEPPPEPDPADYTYTNIKWTPTTTSSGTTWSSTDEHIVLPLYARDHDKWSELKTAYDEAMDQYSLDLIAWNDWRDDSAVYVTLHSGRVKNLLSVTRVQIGVDAHGYPLHRYLHVGLAPFYDEVGTFLGWGAAQEKRVLLTHTIPFGPELPIENSANGWFYLDSNNNDEGLYKWSGSWQKFASGEAFPANPIDDDQFYLHVNSTRDDEGVYVFSTTGGWAHIETPAHVTSYGQWVPYGTGIMTALEKWNEVDISEWVQAPDSFDFNTDPQLQGPF